MELLPTPSPEDADGTGELSMVIAQLLGVERLSTEEDDEPDPFGNMVPPAG